MAILYRQIKTTNNRKLIVRLGDIFTIKGKILDNNSVCREYGVKPLAILVVAFDADRIYFTSIGLNKEEVSKLQIGKRSIILSGLTGKKFKLTDPYLRSIFISKAVESGSPRKINGIPFSMIAIDLNPYALKNASLRRVRGRLRNICDWPEVSLAIWAKIHLGIVGPINLHRLKNMEDKHNLINSILQAKISEERYLKKLHEGPKSADNTSGFSGDIKIGIGTVDTAKISGNTIDGTVWKRPTTGRISYARSYEQVCEVNRIEPTTIPVYEIGRAEPTMVPANDHAIDLSGDGYTVIPTFDNTIQATNVRDLMEGRFENEE